ncbi:MAG: PDZ domain-containing protein [Clostridia bacterium]|nr:PDZ domain-containing protein [Clostridia bacterium]
MKKTVKGVRYGTVFFLLVTAIILTAVATYFYVSGKVDNLSRNQQLYNKLNKVDELVDKNFILSIDPITGNDTILDCIIEGYLEGLGDEFSYYLDETDYRLSSNITEAEGFGIGIRAAYDKKTGTVLVEYVQNNSPAQESGLRKGDLILSINGNDVTKLGYRNAVSSLFGVENSQVVLTLRRGDETLSVSVRRARFEPFTVRYKLLESGIGYIYLADFDLSTPAEFSAALEALRLSGARGIVLDLRANGGGSFEAMLSVLDSVMPSGIMCTISDMTDGGTVTSHYSDEAHMSESIILLQNAATSDVAEVFVSALQDTGTSVVGTVSRGKGVGQRDIPLSDGTAIHISTYEYITPNGTYFNGQGILPNLSVPLSQISVEDILNLSLSEDTQLSTALQQLRAQLGTS